MALVLAVLVSAVAPQTSLAQTDEERELAAALFRESAEAYRAGNMELAVTLLRRAYELDPAPVLQYNLARTLEGMGDTAGAIEAYERYLEIEPEAEDRPAIEERLEALRSEQAALDAAAEAETDEFLAGEDGMGPEQQPEEPMPPPKTVNPVPWVIAGVGALLLGSAAITGSLANGRHDDALATDVHADRVRLADEADNLALITNVNLAIGGVFLLAGGIWGVIDLTSGGGDDDLSLRIGPGQLSLSGRF